jgi:hypothetical protein
MGRFGEALAGGEGGAAFEQGGSAAGGADGGGGEAWDTRPRRRLEGSVRVVLRPDRGEAGEVIAVVCGGRVVEARAGRRVPG